MKAPDLTVNDADQPGSYLWAAARHAIEQARTDHQDATKPAPELEPDRFAPGPGQLDLFGADA